uniref:Uncharacterized protein n=1 Tax=Ralstonia syzygii R24 TaxID=907261 RepID=G2ZYT8_9RALS|nr:hypothetical protein RALSY_10996 [Ralstonia syzygii R24]
MVTMLEHVAGLSLRVRYRRPESQES